VSFALPYAILKELFEPNAKIWVPLEGDGAITEAPGRNPATGEPIKIPSGAASTCQLAWIDLVSISDDELQQITRLGASTGKVRNRKPALRDAEALRDRHRNNGWKEFCGSARPSNRAKQIAADVERAYD